MENIMQMSFVRKLWYLANKEDVLFVKWIENEDAISIELYLLESYLYSSNTIFPNQNANTFVESLIKIGFDCMLIKTEVGQKAKFYNKDFTRDGEKLDLIVNSRSKELVAALEQQSLMDTFPDNKASKCQLSEQQLQEFFKDDYSKVQNNEIKIRSEQM